MCPNVHHPLVRCVTVSAPSNTDQSNCQFGEANCLEPGLDDAPSQKRFVLRWVPAFHPYEALVKRTNVTKIRLFWPYESCGITLTSTKRHKTDHPRHPKNIQKSMIIQKTSKKQRVIHDHPTHPHPKKYPGKRPRTVCWVEFIPHILSHPHPKKRMDHPSKKVDHPHLVGGLEHDLYFSIWLGNFIIPTDELIFFRGVGLNHQPVIFNHVKWEHPPCSYMFMVMFHDFPL